MSLELEGEDEGRRGFLKLIAYYGKSIEGKSEEDILKAFCSELRICFHLSDVL